MAWINGHEARIDKTTVRFDKLIRKSDGEIGQVSISQGMDEIVLTTEQARSLLTVLTVRYGKS